MRSPSRLLAIVWLLSTFCAVAAPRNVPEGFRSLELDVEGQNRTALVYLPERLVTNAPVVFVFHGHGGTARQAARSISIHREWPEAICVYMQGLNTATPLVDREGRRPGWQLQPGTSNDRDLKFFDAVLSKLTEEYHIDRKSVFATGHSNGGAFVYLLWLKRSADLAAVAPSGAAATFANRLTPKPALHIAGRNDTLVKFSWQETTLRAVRKVNNCDDIGKSWENVGTIYASTSATPLATWIYSGGHQFPARGPELIATFFKQQRAGSLSAEKSR